MLNFIKNKINKIILDKRFSEILTGSFWTLGAQIIATIFGMIISVVIARCYGAEILGVMDVLNSFIMLATIFTVLGTNTSLLRLIPEHIAKYSYISAFKIYNKTSKLVLGASIITGSILFWGANFLAFNLFSKPHLKFYFALGSLFIVFQSLMLLNIQAVRGLRMIKIFAIMQLLPTLSKFIILIALTIFLYHKDNPIYAMLASITITALTGSYILNRVFKSKSSTGTVIQFMSIKEILAISLPMLMTTTMTFVIGQTGIIMIGIFHSEAEVGYYSVALKLATLTTFILSAMNSMVGPKFSELYHRGNMEELFYIAKKSAKLIFWTTTPILIAIVIFGYSIIKIIFGIEFTIAYKAMLLLVLGQFVNSISGATGLFMNMTGHQNSFKNIMIIAAIANLGLNFFLVPKYGINGSASSAMISFMFWNICTLYFIKLKFGKTTGYFPSLSFLNIIQLHKK